MVAQRRPVAEHDARVAGAALRRLEPRPQAVRLPARGALAVQLQPPFRVQVAHARERVEQEAQPLAARQRLAPAPRLGAVQQRELPRPGVAAQERLQFARELQRPLQRPRRQQPRVHHRVAQFRVVVQHRTAPQPLDQLVAVGRGQHRVQLVPGARRRAGRQRQQGDVVVAERAHRAVAQAAEEAQRLERPRAAVDQVADAPQRVAAAVEADPLQQRLQLVQAALDVAHGVHRHRRLSAGSAASTG